jgi:murein DD-endopeptidase MepM/ murein hydrolase activator NlpD
VRDSNTFIANKQLLKTEWRARRVEGTVDVSLNHSLAAQGLTPNEVGALVGDLTDRIMGWRIDFFTEQRKGDTFEILFEQEFPVGSNQPLWHGQPRILAFRYNGSGTRLKENLAFRYQAPGSKEVGFYDEKGSATRRAFLRAPFTNSSFRVSSRFNPKRMHPILRTYRPHHGTDYAASRGTPVSAIGNGTVVRAEWYKGYGNCVDIRHPNGFVSRYGHLSSMAVRRGQSVLQGRMIGRVGSTGLSTGPHLHFEMLVGGVQKDFLRMSFPPASSVPDASMADFTATRDTLLQRLDAGKRPAGESVKVASR